MKYLLWYIDVMSECKQCKKKSLTRYNTFVAVISIYLIITSVLGTIELYKFISSLF
jgi:ABC-type arginine/histidine transport system permease subunit